MQSAELEPEPEPETSAMLPAEAEPEAAPPNETEEIAAEMAPAEQAEDEGNDLTTTSPENEAVVAGSAAAVEMAFEPEPAATSTVENESEDLPEPEVAAAPVAEIPVAPDEIPAVVADAAAKIADCAEEPAASVQVLPESAEAPAEEFFETVVDDPQDREEPAALPESDIDSALPVAVTEEQETSGSDSLPELLSVAEPEPAVVIEELKSAVDDAPAVETAAIDEPVEIERPMEPADEEVSVPVESADCAEPVEPSAPVEAASEDTVLAEDEITREETDISAPAAPEETAEVDVTPVESLPVVTEEEIEVEAADAGPEPQCNEAIAGSVESGEAPAIAEENRVAEIATVEPVEEQPTPPAPVDPVEVDAESVEVTPDNQIPDPAAHSEIIETVSAAIEVEAAEPAKATLDEEPPVPEEQVTAEVEPVETALAAIEEESEVEPATTEPKPQLNEIIAGSAENSETTASPEADGAADPMEAAPDVELPTQTAEVELVEAAASEGQPAQGREEMAPPAAHAGAAIADALESSAGASNESEEELHEELVEEESLAEVPEPNEAVAQATPEAPLAAEPGTAQATEPVLEELSAALTEASDEAATQPEANDEAVAEPSTVAVAEEMTEPVAVVEEATASPEAVADSAAVAEPAAEVAPAVVPTPVAFSFAEALHQPADAATAPAPSSLFDAAKPAERTTAEKVAAALKARGEDPEQSPFSVMVGQVYDGPLDLLLDLIRKQDIDIYDIPIAKITAQFLAYVNQLKSGDVDVAGEFIYMAALLIHIKSKMLLPRAPAGPEDQAEDPRRELVERLLEHERFKNAAQMLQEKQMLEAASWTNPGIREFRQDAEAEPEIAADTTDLVRIFQVILERARNRPVINVNEESVTVGQMIQFLSRRLTMEDKPVALRRLLSHTRSERALIAMFLAVLELVRMQAILLRQDRHFSEIFIKKGAGFEAAMNQGLASARDDWR